MPITFIATIVALLSFPLTNRYEVLNADEYLEWDITTPLRWEDFQGVASPEKFGDAGTAVLMRATPYRSKHKLEYDITILFDKKKSWCRKKSDHLLAHEQLHFDIAELYGRKIRQAIEKLQAQHTTDYKLYHAAIEELMNESNVRDERYDKETLHGALPQQQAKWKKTIQDELNNLHAFRKKQMPSKN